MFFVAKCVKTKPVEWYADGRAGGAEEDFKDEWHVVETHAEAKALYRRWIKLARLHNLVMGPISNSIDDHLNLPPTLAEEISKCP